MIKKIIIVIILVCVLFLLTKIYKEHFHEVSEQVGSDRNTKCVEEDTVDTDTMIGCSKYKDFNPDPEKQPFILSRCLLNHTTENGGFKDDIVEGCPRHETLCESSGCKGTVNYFWKNLETLKSITDMSVINRYQNEDSESGSGSGSGSNGMISNYDGLLSDCSCNYTKNRNSTENNQYQKWVQAISK